MVDIKDEYVEEEKTNSDLNNDSDSTEKLISETLKLRGSFFYTKEDGDEQIPGSPRNLEKQEKDN